MTNEQILEDAKLAGFVFNEDEIGMKPYIKFAELTKARAIPDGYVLVPIEPSEAMIRAACLNQAIKSPDCDTPLQPYKDYEEWADNHSGGIVERIRDMQVNDYTAMIKAAQQERN